MANRADDEARLVLADALQQAGDPHGELIAVEIAAAREPDSDRRRNYVTRAHQLRAEHGEQIAGAITRHASSHEWSRGFVDTVTMTGQAFVAHGRAMFSSHPIETLEIAPLTDEAIALVAQSPALAMVRRIVLRRADRAAIALRPLGESPHLDELHELRLHEIFARDWPSAFQSIRAPKLARLRVSLGDFDLRAISRIVRQGGDATLERVVLHAGAFAWSVPHARAAFEALGSCRKLREFEIEDYGLVDDELVRRLVDGPAWSTLESLRIRGGKLGPAWLEVLASRGACALRTLDVGRVDGAVSARIDALLRSPAGARLERVIVDGKRYG